MTDSKQYQWCKKHIHPWWTDYADLNYSNEPFNSDSSVVQWRKLGYTQIKFTGDMYDMRNAEPPWIQGFRSHFDWQYFSWSVYRMTPGCVLPEHQDTYAKFVSLHNIQDTRSICRAVIFLENWQQGHYFDIDKTPMVNWAAGDVVIWCNDVPHCAANIGTTDRYTLQITGIPNENPFI